MLPKPPPITDVKIQASGLTTAKPIVDAIAVADVPAPLGAEAPQRRLNEAWEGRWEARVVGAGIDSAGKAFEQIATAPGSGTSWPIAVFGAEACQNTGAVQEVMNQGIDGDHPGAGRDPALLEQ